MQFLVKLYDKTLQWAQHKHAARYLVAVCFVEASVFPIPPYFMLAPMALSRPERAVWYAAIATMGSVLGGLVGYALGYYVFQPLVLPVVEYFGYEHAYAAITARFQDHGFLAVLLAGFLPMPFKVVAIAAGFMHVSIPLFMLAAVFGRGTKFFAVSLVMKFGGVRMEGYIRDVIAKVGIVFVILAGTVIGYKVLC
jgi:membrane protein YqaA with SNARE-associated domain